MTDNGATAGIVPRMIVTCYATNSHGLLKDNRWLAVFRIAYIVARSFFYFNVTETVERSTRTTDTGDFGQLKIRPIKRLKVNSARCTRSLKLVNLATDETTVVN